ncbi:MAG: ABC transporter ATP-binding protein [Planctomycetota bacterium]
MTSDLLIEIDGLEKTYRRGFGKGFPALRGVSLSVGRGSVFGLLGPNGAGKTTMLKCLLGLVRPSGGSAKLFGQPIGKTQPLERLGYLPEAHRLPGYLTGRQVLTLYGMYSGRDKAWLNARIDGWLDRVGMLTAADEKVKTYSKGMMQRVGLAQALIHEPELVFLDEPTDGIDPVGRAVIREIVAELKQKGVTIFINSHLLMEVEQICDRAVILVNGQIAREGTMAELTPESGRTTFTIAGQRTDLEAMVAPLGENFVGDERGFGLDLTQEQQDAVVDRLRAGGVSIMSISRRKLSLEDTFIDLVKEDRA